MFGGFFFGNGNKERRGVARTLKIISDWFFLQTYLLFMSSRLESLKVVIVRAFRLIYVFPVFGIEGRLQDSSGIINVFL